MSRLESAIRRLEAQKIALNWASEQIMGKTGSVLEFGLGNGRTYDHLRKLLPDRDIFVFEREIAAHPDCIPDIAFQFLGEFSASLPDAVAKLGAGAILAHLDIGSGRKGDSLDLAQQIAPLVKKLLLPQAIIISDQEIEVWKKNALGLPAGIEAKRIYLYRLP